MRLKSFGTITLPELNGRDNGLGSQARSNIINLQDGGYDLDGNSVYLQPMNISRSAVITENIDATIDNLFGEMRKGRMTLKAEMHDGSERQTYAKMSMQMRDVSADKYLCEQPFNLQWSSTYPYWLNSIHEPDNYDHGLLFDDSLAFDNVNSSGGTLDGTDLSDTITVNNASKFKIYRVFFNFEISAQGTTGLIEVKNNTNGTGFTWNSSLSTTTVKKRLDLDCLSKVSFSSNSTNEYENLTILNNNLDWFCLEAGNNSIEISAPNLVTPGGPGVAGTLAYRVIWSTHYL